jgi:hypothetical protein
MQKRSHPSVDGLLKTKSRVWVRFPNEPKTVGSRALELLKQIRYPFENKDTIREAL